MWKSIIISINQVILPRLRRIFLGNRNHHHRVPARFSRFPQQLHSRLFRGSSSLFLVTFKAARNNIFPTGSPPHGSWDHMIVGKMLGGETFTAVLAAVSIPQVDILPRKPHGILVKTNKLKKPHHRRQFKRNSGGMNFTIVGFENFNLIENH